MHKSQPKPRRNAEKAELVTDKQLVSWGMRPPLLKIDRSVFKKTPAEKEALKHHKQNTW